MLGNVVDDAWYVVHVTTGAICAGFESVLQLFSTLVVLFSRLLTGDHLDAP